MYSVIVLCPLESKRANRWDWNNPKVIREYGYWKTDKRLLSKIKNYKFMPTTKLETKLPRIACNEGHLNILKRIVKEKLHNVFVCEDDSVIQWDKINKFLNTLDKLGKSKDPVLIYVGGKFDYPKIKDWGTRKPSIYTLMKNKSNKGLNLVTDDFIITGAFGYFIRNPDVAKYILNNCKGSTSKYISNLTDVMLARIPNLTKYYFYPSLITIETKLKSSLGGFEHGKSWKNYTI